MGPNVSLNKSTSHSRRSLERTNGLIRLMTASPFKFGFAASFNDAGALRLPARLFRRPEATDLANLDGADRLERLPRLTIRILSVQI
jgi:hypothetical protein